MPQNFVQWIIFAAIVAIAIVAVHAFGIVIPPFVYTILWICVVACIAIAAIRFMQRQG